MEGPDHNCNNCSYHFAGPNPPFSFGMDPQDLLDITYLSTKEPAATPLDTSYQPHGCIR